MRIPDFEKQGGLLPAIVQDAITRKVLMLGYMNQEAYDKTLNEKKITFFSRSKNRLWTKGETSNNFLHLISSSVDCDNDTILLQATPDGPTCHTGDDTCWEESNDTNISFISYLRDTITARKGDNPDKSYTARLLQGKLEKTAQKVGEEAVELVIEAMKRDNKELFLGEAADLLFHYLVLLEHKGYTLEEVVAVLQSRHKK